jgi:protein TonB
VTGRVVLSAVIDKTGNVVSLSVVGGPEVLLKITLDAVKQWEYSPFLIDGKPTDVITEIRLFSRPTTHSEFRASMSRVSPT